MRWGFSLVAGALLACGVPNGPNPPEEPAPAPSADPGATAATDGGAAVAAAVVDAGPEAEAGAAATGSHAYVELCNKSWTYTDANGSVTYRYAEHLMPGKTVTELSAVRAIHAMAWAPGYTHFVAGDTEVGAGKVASVCQPSNNEITFVVP